MGLLSADEIALDPPWNRLAAVSAIGSTTACSASSIVPWGA